MTLFFKNAFKPFFEQWKANKKASTEVESSLLEFSNTIFPGLVSKMTNETKFEFIELVKLLVFSHRHNKNDSYLQNSLVDFSIVREPMYKYSRVAQEKIFSYPAYTFLFAWFALRPEAQDFSMKKFNENKDERYPERMV